MNHKVRPTKQACEWAGTQISHKNPHSYINTYSKKRKRGLTADMAKIRNFEFIKQVVRSYQTTLCMEPVLVTSFKICIPAEPIINFSQPTVLQS